jgi:hypothetical protein
VSALTIFYDDPPSLAAAFESDLSKGRAFVKDCGGVEARTACELVLVVGTRSHLLTGEIVFVRDEDPGRGVGVKLALEGDALEKLRAFVAEAAQPEPEPEAASESESESDSEGHAQMLHERMRHLSSAEQQRIASSGALPERIMLERLYGPNVWETLLHNSRLTIPEVARIAKKGTLPRPLIELIAANGSWCAAGEVQRALLANPRSSTTVITKILNTLSKTDLARVPQQTAYPMAVRQTAKRLLLQKP